MRIVLLPLALLLGAACAPPLEEGRYAFEVPAVLQDSCSPSPSGEIQLPDAVIETAGETIRLSFDPEGPLVPGLTEASGRRAMVGRFLAHGPERFIADATFDVIRDMGGVSCIVFSHASMTAEVPRVDGFDGRLRINYRRRAEAQAACLPGCVLEVEFTARRTGD